MRIFLVLFWSVGAWANVPADVGDFSGLLFTGPSITQSVSVKGGRLFECKLDAGQLSDITRCLLDSASITVHVGEGRNDVYLFDSASIISIKNRPPNYYYFRGSRMIEIAGRVVKQGVVATLIVDPAKPKQLSGHLELTQSKSRSWFEVYAPQ